MIYDQATLSKLNFKSLSNYDKIMFVFARGFTSIADREEAFEYVMALRKNDKEFIKEFEKYGHDPHTMVYNKLACEYHNLPWYKVEFNPNGYIEAWKLKDKPDAINNQLQLF